MVGKQLSHYLIEEQIGKGGWGIVYRGRDARLFRSVAVKILPENLVSEGKYLRRFMQEARAASALNHPNICTVYDVGEERGLHFIVMELVEGETLREILQAGRKLPEAKVVEVGVQVCEALAVAHQNGIVHRDIKPENIMLTKDGRVKVMDFGLAKLAWRDADDFTGDERTPEMGQPETFSPRSEFLTSLHTFPGTLGYMSPEQIRKDKLDGRADLFSVGVVLYELVTGKLPFAGNDGVSITQSILHDEPKRPSGFDVKVSPETERAVMKALAKDREARYETADLLRKDLGKSPTAPGRRSARQNRTRLLAVSGVAALLLLTTVFFVLSGREFRDTSPRALELEPFSWSGPWGLNASLFYDDQHVVVKGDVGQDSSAFWAQNIQTGVKKAILYYHRSEFGFVSGDFSRGGDRFVFSSNLGPQNNGIFVHEIGGDRPRKVLDFGFAPKWSPEGGRITFCNASTTVVGLANAVFVHDLKTGSLQKVSPENGRQFAEPVWSPNGNWILCVGGLGSRWELWLIEVATRKAFQLSHEDAWIQSPAWAQNGRDIFFVSNSSGSSQVWRAEFDQKTNRFASQPAQLTFAEPISWISLAPAGDKLLVGKVNREEHIAFVASVDDSIPSLSEVATNLVSNVPEIDNIEISPDKTQLVLEAMLAGGKRTLMLVSTRNGEQTKLYDEQEPFAPTWSHDGQWIAFDSGGGDQADIWRIPRTGGTAEKIVSHPGADWLPTYAPDGRRLCFLSNRSGQFDLWILDLLTGEAAQLTKTKNPESRGFWSPDGDKLAFFEVDSEKDSAKIWLYIVASQQFDLLKSMSVTESNVEILSKLLWLSNDELLYWTDWPFNNSFMAISLKNRDVRKFANVNGSVSGSRNCALRDNQLYFITGTYLNSTSIAYLPN